MIPSVYKVATWHPVWLRFHTLIGKIDAVELKQIRSAFYAQFNDKIKIAFRVNGL